MVNSRLNNKINYFETKDINKNDQGVDAELWGLEINGKTIDIIVGNLNYDYKNKDIIYLNIYVVYNDKVDSKIGVYEITTSELPLIEQNMNEDTLELEMLGEPLFFSFVDNDFLEQYYVDTSPETSPVEEKVDEQEQEQEEQELIKKETIDGVGEVEEESEQSSEEESEQSSEEEKSTLEQLSQETEEDELWINNFFNKKNYNIIDNEGGGDCLFAVIRDAFKGVTKAPLSIKKIRQLLASKVTEEVFKNYYELYQNFITENKSIKNSMKQIKNEYEKLTIKFKESKDVEEQKTYSLLLDELKEKMKVKKAKLSLNNKLINEYRFMKNVESVDDLKEKIKSCDFWAETWAITTLENALNIKLILLSSENYKYEDSENVLLCGQVNDENQGIFTPQNYILVDYNGYHYQLITYNDQRLFDFNSLPLQIKKLVVNKCLERQGGIYSFIPDFNKLKEELESLKKQKRTRVEKQKEESLQQVEEKGEKQKSLLYDEGEGTVFQFYSKSGDKLPGKGAGESIKPELNNKYLNLNSIKDWRKTLSNFHIAPFTLDDLTWNSVEHFYQASKFKKNNPEFYKMFSVESDTEISKDPAMAKGAGGKTGKYAGQQVRDKSIQIDDDFFTSGRNALEMERAMYAKFSQNEECKRTLLETKDAKLQHFSRGQPPIVFYDLMNVRRQLRER